MLRGMTQPQARRALGDLSAVRRLGYATVTCVEQTGSTNTDLCGQPGLADATVLVAEEQVAGRGRLGRQWSAPARSQLIVSISFTCPGLSTDRLGLVPLLVGMSMAEGIREATGVAVDLKWPNDLLVTGKKLAGILVEAPEVSPVPRLVVGFGVNYDLAPAELPVEHATSLALETSDLPPRETVLLAILRHVWEDMQRFRALGGAPVTVMSRYRALCATLGQPVRVALPGGQLLDGTAEDVTEAGELVVRADGARHVVAAGDVVHVRPASGEMSARGESPVDGQLPVDGNVSKVGGLS